MTPYTVGITGGSASGKTYLIRQLQQRFAPSQLALLSLDNYYRPRHELLPDSKGNPNFDHPSALDLERFAHDLHRLQQGQTVRLTEYTFNNQDRAGRELEVHPAPLLLAEGMFVWHHPAVERLLDLKVFVQSDEHRKLTRRLQRDVAERAYTVEQILEQYDDHVVPMYRRFVEPLLHEADVVLLNNGRFDHALSVLESHLRAQLAARSGS